MTNHPNNSQQSPTHHLIENDSGSLSLINREGMPALGDITSLEEVEEDNEENDHSLDDTEQEIENLLNDSALFENHPIDTSGLSHLNVPTLKESMTPEPLPANSKATPKNSDSIRHIPTLNTEADSNPSLVSNTVSATTAPHKTNDTLNVDCAINEATPEEIPAEMEALDSAINASEQHRQLEAQPTEETLTNPPQNATAHTSDNRNTGHTSIDTEQTQARLQIEETATEQRQLASQIDQQIDDVLSTPSEILTVPACNDNNLTHTNNSQNANEPPAKPSTTAQAQAPLNSTPPAKSTLSPHDGLHKQLSEKMDQFILEAAATLTDELNRQLSTRLENIILNSIDTILPSLLEQIGQSLRQEVKNNVKQQLPTLINEAMGQTTRVR